MKVRSVYYIILFFSIIIFTDAKAQRPTTDPKHENHYKIETINTDDLTIEFIDGHSQQEFTQVKIKVTNKTKDYILIKPEEIIFKYEFGEYKPASSMLQGKFTLIEPLGTRSRTLKVTGGNKFHVEKLKVLLNGFYKIGANGKSLDAPDFKLPAAVNEFTVGTCKCSLDKLVKETKETNARFKCTYTGSDILLIDPKKSALKLENGQEFANDDRKAEPVLLMSGDDTKINNIFHVPGKVTDMQFANMLIIWRDTFAESKPQKISIPASDFVLDPGMTEAKNR